MSEQRFQFDKFMKDIEEKERLQSEKAKLLQNQEVHNHTRELNRRYREHPLNRIVINKKVEK